MQIDKISYGDLIPDEFNVIIENSLGGVPVKYEIDKESGAMFVDRILHTSMTYPGNYGFIPHTLSGDGDPVDVLAVGRIPVMPGAVMAVRPVGVLLMEDDGGQDEKIIAVPVNKVHPYYNDVQNYTDLRQVYQDQIEHFFTHYKDLEKGKWSKTLGWGDAEMAKELVKNGVERAQGNAVKSVTG
jgi:inorganic pyrophosphatase